VGAFSCTSDRPPPHLACGLVEWEHLYNMHATHFGTRPADVGSVGPLPALQRGLTGLSVSRKVTSDSVNAPAAPAAAESEGAPSGAGFTRNNCWTATNSESGLTSFLSQLPSGEQYQLCLLGSAPSRPFLERNLPRKVKMWLGMHF
jgi:hypothetical protein